MYSTCSPSRDPEASTPNHKHILPLLFCLILVLFYKCKVQHKHYISMLSSGAQSLFTAETRNRGEWENILAFLWPWHHSSAPPILPPFPSRGPREILTADLVHNNNSYSVQLQRRQSELDPLNSGNCSVHTFRLREEGSREDAPECSQEETVQVGENEGL